MPAFYSCSQEEDLPASQACLGSVERLYGNEPIRKQAKSQRRVLEDASACSTSPARLGLVHTQAVQQSPVAPGMKFRGSIELMVIVAIGVELGFTYEKRLGSLKSHIYSNRKR